MKILSTIGLVFMSMNALALPILTESVDGSGLLATIYPDHEDSNKVYFLPNRGGLQKDSRGIPEFGMSYWGVTKEAPDAGGYFAGIFNVWTGADLSKAVNAHLQKGFKVAVMPVQQSYVHFKERNGERVMVDYFKEIDLPEFAGRAEDSFSLSASLSKRGAQMLAAQLRSGAVGTDLNYCYEVTGLSPVFHAKITLNYHKVYEHFLAQAKVRKWWVKINIRTEIEKLIENKSIKVEINGGDASKYDYIMSLVDRMSEKFFEKPVLENRRNSAGGTVGISWTKIFEDRTQTFELKQRELIKRDFCLGLAVSELKEFPFLIVNVDEASL